MEAATDYVLSSTRLEQERRGCIRTFTGLYVNPLQLREEDIRIEDIAHHLSNLCRYTGACPKFYSVAQHSAYVAAAMLKRYDMAEAGLAGLLHDAAEAYFNDLASPVKHDPRMQWYRDMEHEATLMIFDVFKVDRSWLLLTKPYDDEVFRDEVATWWGGQFLLHPRSPVDAEQMFLRMFTEIARRIV